jgi:fructose-specific phosphotransferase system IIC component
METQELLTIVVTTLAAIAAYSLARDPAAVPGAVASQGTMARTQPAPTLVDRGW